MSFYYPGSGGFGFGGSSGGSSDRQPQAGFDQGEQGTVDTLFGMGDDQNKSDVFKGVGLSGKGRNEALTAFKRFTPLEYAIQAHNYGLYNELHPQLADSIRATVALLRDPNAMALAVRHGLLNSAPEIAATQAAGIEAAGGSPSSAAGTVLRATNAANRQANEYEANQATPQAKLARLQALHAAIEQSAPDLTRLLQMQGQLAQQPVPGNGLGSLMGGIGQLAGLAGLGGGGAGLGGLGAKTLGNSLGATFGMLG